jgi:hypothetical protein
MPCVRVVLQRMLLLGEDIASVSKAAVKQH